MKHELTRAGARRENRRLPHAATDSDETDTLDDRTRCFRTARDVRMVREHSEAAAQLLARAGRGSHHLLE